MAGQPAAAGQRECCPYGDFRQTFARFRQIFGKFRSFSAVSAPIFASSTTYAFCSIFQNLPDYQAEILEIWQNFANVATIAKTNC